MCSQRRGGAPVPPASVGGRLLGILTAFTEDRPLLTLSEISERTGLPLTTAHRLVGELTAGGALERGPDRRYRIGLRLWEIGSLAPRSVGLRESALPFIEDLYEATHQHAQLAVLDGHDVVFLERISGRHAVEIISRVGGRLPAHATGVGLVLLAHADRALQEEVLAGPLKQYGPKTIHTAHQLRRVLADVRRDGIAISVGQIEPFVLSVAAPIFGPDDTVIAALSVVVPSDNCDPRALVPVVRAAARGISRVLGAPRTRHLPHPVHRERHGEDQLIASVRRHAADPRH
jgi:DNA-binding IclR family transcriptional regulator